MSKAQKIDYQMKRNDDYILTEGQHKGIVSEEVWEKAHAKRLRTGVKQPSKIWAGSSSFVIRSAEMPGLWKSYVYE